MVDNTSVGIQDIVDGFQITFHKNSAGDGNIEFVNISEKKSDFVDLRSEITSADALGNLSYLGSEPVNSFFAVGDSSQIALAVKMVAGDGECTIVPLVVDIEPGESVPFTPASWSTSGGVYCAWGGDDSYIYGTSYPPTGYYSYFVPGSTAVAEMRPPVMVLTVYNPSEFEFTVSEANDWKIQDANLSTISSIEGTTVVIGAYETKNVVFNLTWGAYNLGRIGFNMGNITNPLRITNIDYRSASIVTPLTVLPSYKFTASSVQDSDGQYFAPVKSFQAFGAKQIFPLVSEISGNGNKVSIAAKGL